MKRGKSSFCHGCTVNDSVATESTDFSVCRKERKKYEKFKKSDFDLPLHLYVPRYDLQRVDRVGRERIPRG